MEDNGRFDIVTGSFGFTGRYITRLLLEKGIRVRTLTNHPNKPNPFGSPVEVFPYNFDEPGKMVEAMRGAHTVYNTYWVRFNYGRTSYGQAVANVENLIRAAVEAKVKKFVHISIANPVEPEPGSLDYYTGKWVMENALKESGLDYAIIRPTLIYGPEDILINNIAYFLRRFPFFAVPGDGSYRVQPVYIEDVARLAVELSESKDNVVCDAVGPEIYSFRELVHSIKKHTGGRAIVLKAPRIAAYLCSRMLDPLVKDVVLIWGEVTRLMEERLVSRHPPLCSTRFSEWIRANGGSVGVKYSSELERHFK
ncbi:MAG: NAD(P)H-binding protein [Deltaproteobacteria bacterium]|nr:NAD(P)H-binding protein [Deltaproteobacteria bacterium]